MTQQTITRKPAAAKVSAAKLKELESRIQPATAADKPKAAPVAKAPAKKANAKPAAKAKAAPVKVAAKVSGIAYAIGQSCRPVAGAKLAAYSAAWMGLTGFAKGATLPRAAVAKIAGERAIAYHTGAGNMTSTKDGLKLTAKGISVFTSRAVQPELVAAYESVLKTGKENATVGAKAAHIVAMNKAA